jgi:putative holliday junction resolvase
LQKDTPPQEPGRLLGIDLGAKRVGVAVTDESRTSLRPLPLLRRSNWKRLLEEIGGLCREFDVKGLVVGLPLRLDGAEGEAAAEARRVARNLQLSLHLPVYLQDERLTSRAAEESLRAERLEPRERNERVDGEAAALILSDFLSCSESPEREV